MVIASQQIGAHGGEPREKDSPYMHAMGEVDRLNCLLGLLNSKVDFPDLRDLVESVQRDLLNLSAELSHPARFIVNARAVSHLEHHAQRLGATLPPLDVHAVPGGTEAAALCHYSWATCRSVERTLLRLDGIDPAPGAARLSYVDKLSELLLVLARTLNERADGKRVR